MRIQIDVGENEEAAALALLHEKVPASKALRNITAGELKLEADLDTPAGSVRVQIGVTVGKDANG